MIEKQHAIPESKYDDFYNISGNLADFVKSPYYQQRCEELGEV